MRLAAGLLLCAVLNGVSHRLRPQAWPLARPLAAQASVEDAALFSVGMRRLAADLELVRLLIYYGTPQAQAGEALEPHAEGARVRSSAYPGLARRTMRILDKDPSFGYVALYGAGALAFNLNRPGDALEVLRYALSRDPGNRQYLAYIGAVGFHRSGDERGVIKLLEPVLHEPDCPTLIKHMVAFLYVRTGQRRQARLLYREILETSQDEGYRAMAARALERLGRGG
ncbi:MAG: hypothetical protein PHF00_01105 [Elusimicrobia bacterium]|nr:hypothetical protein [Elusimicrobiota bacterium]